MFWFVTGFKNGVYHTMSIKARDESEARNKADMYFDEIIRFEEETWKELKIWTKKKSKEEI